MPYTLSDLTECEELHSLTWGHKYDYITGLLNLVWRVKAESIVIYLTLPDVVKVSGIPSVGRASRHQFSSIRVKVNVTQWLWYPETYRNGMFLRRHKILESKTKTLGEYLWSPVIPSLVLNEDPSVWMTSTKVASLVSKRTETSVPWK